MARGARALNEVAAVPEAEVDPARFEAPPSVPSASEDTLAASGELALWSSNRAAAERFLEGLAIGGSFAAAASMMHLTLDASPVVLGMIALAATLVWWTLLRARQPGPARVRWDAWGITEDAPGEVLAISWASARAIVVRSPKHTFVQVSDDEGRTITCATGHELPGALRSARCWTTEAELKPLLEAVAQLPRSARARTERTLEVAPISAGASALLAVLTFFAVHVSAGRGPSAIVAVALATLVLAMAGTPALLDVVSVVRRWRSLRSARSSEARAEGPYRGRASGRGTAQDATTASRASRRRALAAIMRVAIALSGIVVLWTCVLVARSRVVPVSRFEPPASLREPPPPPPGARPIAPRDAPDPEADRRAVGRWRHQGPYYERGAHCEPGRGCLRVPVAVDPERNLRVECVGAEAMQECVMIVGRMPRRGEY